MKQFWFEILTVMIVKIILLTGIWFLSFNKPQKFNDKTAGEHILIFNSK